MKAEQEVQRLRDWDTFARRSPTKRETTMPAEQTIGDPDCICAGTGLVCRLGPDRKPAPESIAVCECVPAKARQEARQGERERMLNGERIEGDLSFLDMVFGAEYGQEDIDALTDALDVLSPQGEEGT